MQERRLLIERDHLDLSLVQQCSLLGIHRSIDYNLGCTTQQTYELKKIDSDYFGEE